MNVDLGLDVAVDGFVRVLAPSLELVHAHDRGGTPGTHPAGPDPLAPGTGK